MITCVDRAVRPSRLVSAKAKDDLEQFVRASDISRRQDVVSAGRQLVQNVDEDDDVDAAGDDKASIVCDSFGSS